MLIYRIQDIADPKRGPWGTSITRKQHGCGSYGTAARQCPVLRRHAGPHHSAWDPPGPSSEVSHLREAFDPSRHYFGFASKAQLRRWFKSSRGRRALQDAGFELAVYAVDKARAVRGGWQAIFELRQAERVGTLDLVTLKGAPA